jgi:hypothetical protein
MLVEATVTLPKSRFVGLVGGFVVTTTGLVPIPDRLTVFGDSHVGDPNVLLAMESVPLRGPPTVGVITTAIEHVAPAARGVAVVHIVPVGGWTANSGDAVIDVKLTATLWLFLTVTVWGLLVAPTSALARLALAVTVNGLVPVPRRLTVLGKP